MLTGRLPFEAEQPFALVQMHRTEPPPSVADFRPEAPARLESLVAAMLAKDPHERPPDGSALVAELAAPAGERTATMPAPRTASYDRRVRFGIAALVLALLAAGGVALALVATHDEPPATSTSQAVSTHKARTHTATAPPPVTTPSTKETTTETTTPSTTASTATTRPQTTAPTETQPPTTTEPPVTTAPTTIESLPTTVVGTAPTLPGG
jgi:hypothetical protein